MRYLAAIESDDFKRLPGGIFNRSFIRAYARYVGYDENAAVVEYAKVMTEQSDSPDDVATSPHKSLVYTEGSTRSPLKTLLLAILILAALSLSVWAGKHFYERRVTPKNPRGGMNRPVPGKTSMTRQGERRICDAKEEHNAIAA